MSENVTREEWEFAGNSRQGYRKRKRTIIESPWEDVDRNETLDRCPICGSLVELNAPSVMGPGLTYHQFCYENPHVFQDPAGPKESK